MDAVETDSVDAVRRFNRFYTGRLGLLRERLYDSPYSLPQMRILYELAHRQQATAALLSRDLAMDAAYLSRQLKRFEAQGLLSREPSRDDAREQLISITAEGRKALAPWEQASRREVAAMLAHLGRDGVAEALAAMSRIERLLSPNPPPGPGFLLRPHRAGDMGWVVERHASLYWSEYRFDQEFEALVAEIVAQFLRSFDPAREACWIAEQDGERVGSVFVVRKDDEVAKLRLLIVDPKARGTGLGRRLVQEAVRFAADRGYRRIVLWTQDNLAAARRIYETAGFRLTASEPHQSFGQSLVGETWELELG